MSLIQFPDCAVVLFSGWTLRWQITRPRVVFWFDFWSKKVPEANQGSLKLYQRRSPIPSLTPLPTQAAGSLVSDLRGALALRLWLRGLLGCPLLLAIDSQLLPTAEAPRTGQSPCRMCVQRAACGFGLGKCRACVEYRQTWRKHHRLREGTFLVCSSMLLAVGAISVCVPTSAPIFGGEPAAKSANASLKHTQCKIIHASFATHPGSS